MTKFIDAWGDVLTQNNILKIAVGSLSVCVVALTVSVLKLSIKEPLVIERSCLSRVVQPTSQQMSPLEIENFLREALSYRFDTITKPIVEYLSSKEISSRDQEQREFSQKQVIQKIVVNSVKPEGNHATVDADRIISVGNIRSVLPFSLNVEISSTSRSQANPYGLVLMETKEDKKEVGH